jgi:hypothetical protein
VEKGIVVVAKGGQDVAGLRRERSTGSSLYANF